MNTVPAGVVPGQPTSLDFATDDLRFRDATKESGLRFVYRNDEEHGEFSIVESMGGGVGLLDYDQDGWQDLWFAGGGRFSEAEELTGRPNGLFRSLAETGRFSRIDAPAGALVSRLYSHGVAVADSDQDGFPDVVVTGYGGLQYYRNLGDGTFQESGAMSGLSDRLWSTSAAWGDLNGDQNPDLYVAHYVNWSFANNPICPGRHPHERDVCPPRKFEPLPDVVYYANGDGSFRDATREAGLRPDGKGLGVALVDIDLDGDLDAYVANDTEPNFLYQNDGHGHLFDSSFVSGAALNDRGLPDGSMGVDLGDYDADGLPDLVVTNYEGESMALYRNVGAGIFRHTSSQQGMSAPGKMFVGWGVKFFDADSDGDDDIVISNGHAVRYSGDAPLAQRPLLFENRDSRFFRVASPAGSYFATEHRGRGLASGDLDRDGRLDVVFTNLNEPATLLLNDSTDSRRLIRVRLVGRRSPRDGTGALLELRQGERSWHRQRSGGGSYASASEQATWFAIDEMSGEPTLTVRWPSGICQSQTLSAVIRDLIIVESDAAKIRQADR